MIRTVALVISVVLHVVVIMSLALPAMQSDDLQSVMIKLKPLEKSEKIEKPPIEKEPIDPMKKEESRQEIKPPVSKPVKQVLTKKTTSIEEIIPDNHSDGLSVDSTPAIENPSNDSDIPNNNQNDIEKPIETIDIEFIRNAYQQSILDKIDNAKKYPIMARRKEKEGSVLVEFLLHHDGSVSDIAVIKEASFAGFNDAAINAVNSAAPFDPIPTEMHITELKISVRLSFQFNV